MFSIYFCVLFFGRIAYMGISIFYYILFSEESSVYALYAYNHT
jgi:hypothetical protein